MRYHAVFVSVVSVVSVAVLGACSDKGSAKPDAAVDAAIDAPPDALLDAPDPRPDQHRFVIDKIHVPTTNNQARMYGLDLDNDQAIDNQLGMVMGTLAGMGFPIQMQTDAQVDTGMSITLAEMVDTDAVAATATVTLFSGTNPMPSACAGAADTICRHHLAGTATFDVAATSAHDAPLAGATVGGVYTAGPGHLHVRGLVPLGGATDILLIGARVKLTGVTATGWGESVIAGAVSQTELDTKVFPAMQVGIMAQVTHDCTALTSPPGCGCASGSTGKTEINLFDTNHDCAVSIDEIKNNSLIQSLFAPDVMVEGQMALSYGIGVTAKHAAFTP